MKTINNGGPAFPRNGHPDKNDLPIDGMSLRDYFAAKAMQGYISGCLHIARAEYIQSAVKSAYKIADAMLAARGQENE